MLCTRHGTTTRSEDTTLFRSSVPAPTICSVLPAPMRSRTEARRLRGSRPPMLQTCCVRGMEQRPDRKTRRSSDLLFQRQQSVAFSQRPCEAEQKPDDSEEVAHRCFRHVVYEAWNNDQIGRHDALPIFCSSANNL